MDVLALLAVVCQIFSLLASTAAAEDVARIVHDTGVMYTYVVNKS
jgi:hypothetical protein